MVLRDDDVIGEDHCWPLSKWPQGCLFGYFKTFPSASKKISLTSIFKTAKKLGLTVPMTLQASADEVIE
jgi:hypothetical protein